MFFLSFFFHATATTEIYTLSLHDALPICQESFWRLHVQQASPRQVVEPRVRAAVERHELGAARRITFWILQPSERAQQPVVRSLRPLVGCYVQVPEQVVQPVPIDG